MGLLSTLFGGRKIKVVFGGAPARSASFSRDLYEQETVRAVIDCIATHAAKAEAMHVRLDGQGRIKEILRNSPYVKLLNQKPNPIMTGFDLKYKLVSQMQTRTTALCHIRWAGGLPEMMLPIPYNSFEMLPIEGGGYAVRFLDPGGREVALDLEEVVVLRRFYNEQEVSGDGNAPIYNSLDMAKASDDGLIEALTVSNKVRGLLKNKKAMLKPQDVAMSADDFARQYQEAAAKGGVVGIDATQEYSPLTITPWSANAAQVREIRGNILRYWRISEGVLTSDFSDSQWQSFYESVIEPILIQMGQAFTNACFTPAERDKGNRILFSSDVLLNMGMQTKTQLLTVAKEIGLFTRNEMRGMFGYHPIEGGDDALISLNYTKSNDLSKYQVGESPKEEENGQDEPAGAPL